MICSGKYVSEQTELQNVQVFPIETYAFRQAVKVLISRYILLILLYLPITAIPISETMKDDFLKREVRGQTPATRLPSAAMAGERKANTFKKSRVAAPCYCVVKVSSSRLANNRFSLKSELQPIGDGHFNLNVILASHAKIAPKSFITVETAANSSAAFRQA
jgi:hypothetical protein